MQLTTFKIIFCTVQLITISIITIIAPRWLERHEKSFITLATIIQIGITYTNNVLLIAHFSKNVLMIGSIGAHNQSSSLTTCMMGWTIMQTLLQSACSVAWLMEEFDEVHCAEHYSHFFFDCFLVPNICQPVLVVSSVGCLVSMVRMKVYFRKIAEQTAVGLISTSADVTLNRTNRNSNSKDLEPINFTREKAHSLCSSNVTANSRTDLIGNMKYCHSETSIYNNKLY